MSKLQKTNTYNEINILSPNTRNEKLYDNENNFNHSKIKLKKRQTINSSLKKDEQKNEEIRKEKTPQEILSLLLKNTFNKTLFKLEKNTKEQELTIKEIGKYFVFFEKKLISMTNGVKKKLIEDEKKRKEEERRQKLMAKKLKTNSNSSHTRSRTVQSIRRNTLKEDSNIMSSNRKSIKNNPNIKMLIRKKTPGNLNLENTPKVRSRTVKTTRCNTNTNIQRVKNNKEIINTPKRIKNEEQEKVLTTIKRKDSRRISRSRKGTIHKREEDKGTERIGRKSIHKIIKKNNSSKKLIKSEEEKNKNNKNINITTNINVINNSKNINSSTNKEEKIITNFSDNNKINDEFDLNKNENIKNININEILNDKKQEQEKEKTIISNELLKELEEYNEKKPKMEESKNNNIEILRNRSRSKNKDNINDYKEMEGSINDMKITLQGLNLLSFPEKKIKFEKKKKPEKDIKREEMINKEINDLLESENQLKLVNNKQKDIESMNKDILKESQIINEEIINTIENDKNILNNSIFENHLNILNKNLEIESYENQKLKNDKENLMKSINNEISANIKDDAIINNNEIKDDINENNNLIKEKEEENKKEKEKENEELKREEDLNNLDKKTEEKTNIEEKKEIIQSESGIMHDEQLVDPNKSSLMSQSSIMNQSAILAEQYVLISRNEGETFSIDNTLKFEKEKILTVLDFLNFQEKMEFTGINRGFIIERIYILNDKREELIRSLDLSSEETIDDLIMKIRLKYSNDELNKNFSEFQISRGAAKAVELLNNPLYSKLFKKPVLDKNSEEICKIYRTLFTLLGEFQIANIPEDQYFWVKCTEYLNNNSRGKIGSFILDKFKSVTFDKTKIVLMNKFLIGMKKKINPNYFPKICGTTGLLIFLIKDALEYCGVIINDKKTQPARILDNLLYYKNSTENLAQIIEYLSGVKTYKIREKKEN